jgi:hypothetical protein
MLWEPSEPPPCNAASTLASAGQFATDEGIASLFHCSPAPSIPFFGLFRDGHASLMAPVSSVLESVFILQ